MLHIYHTEQQYCIINKYCSFCILQYQIKLHLKNLEAFWQYYNRCIISMQMLVLQFKNYFKIRIKCNLV